MMRARHEREREMRDLSVLCPSSFGHLFALWSTFSVPTFFPLFRRGRRKKQNFVLFLFRSFSRFCCFCTKISCACVVHTNTTQRDAMRSALNASSSLGNNVSVQCGASSSFKDESASSSSSAKNHHHHHRLAPKTTKGGKKTSSSNQTSRPSPLPLLL